MEFLSSQRSQSPVAWEDEVEQLELLSTLKKLTPEVPVAVERLIRAKVSGSLV